MCVVRGVRSTVYIPLDSDGFLEFAAELVYLVFLHLQHVYDILVTPAHLLPERERERERERE